MAAAAALSLRAKVALLLGALGLLVVTNLLRSSSRAAGRGRSPTADVADFAPRCKGCRWASEPGEEPAAYAGYAEVPRLRLGPDGTPSQEVAAALARAWKEGKPVVLENYIPTEHLEWWALGEGEAAASRLGEGLGAQEVEVLRYAERGHHREREGARSQDYSTRLMPVDSGSMPLLHFLERRHQAAERPWPASPLRGEQFMFKRKVRKGYLSVPPSKKGKLGAVEEYTRTHVPKPKAVWEKVGAEGACTGAAEGGGGGFSFDDPMLRIQTPFFTFPVPLLQACQRLFSAGPSCSRRMALWCPGALRLLRKRARAALGNRPLVSNFCRWATFSHRCIDRAGSASWCSRAALWRRGRCAPMRSSTCLI